MRTEKKRKEMQEPKKKEDPKKTWLAPNVTSADQNFT
jgi:hypothetical protein